jgi:hypothetical protein
MSCDNDKCLVKYEAPRGLERLGRRVTRLRLEDPMFPPLPRNSEEVGSWLGQAVERWGIRSRTKTEVAKTDFARQHNEYADQVITATRKEIELQELHILAPKETELKVARLDRQAELEEEQHATKIAEARRDTELCRLETVKARAEALRTTKDTELYVLQKNDEIDRLQFPRAFEKPEKPEKQRSNGPAEEAKRRLAAVNRLRQECDEILKDTPEEYRKPIGQQFRKAIDQILAGGKI